MGIYKNSNKDIIFRNFLNSYKNNPRYKFLLGLDQISFDESKYEFYLRTYGSSLDERELKHILMATLLSLIWVSVLVDSIKCLM